MAGRPEKGKRYPKGRLNQMFGSAMLGKLTSAAPDDLSIVSTGAEQGPTMSGDSLSGPDVGALEPLAARRMEAVDTRSGLEKWFKPNSAGEFNNKMAYEEGANNLQLNRALAEKKAQYGYDNMTAKQQFEFNSKMEEMRNNHAITQQGLKAGDTKEQLSLDHINSVAATKGMFNTGKLPLDDLNAPVVRSTLAKSGAEAGFYESPEGQAAINSRFAALEAAPGVANTTKLGDLAVSQRNAAVGERTAGVAEAGVPIAQQNAATSAKMAAASELNANVNQFNSRNLQLPAGSSQIRLDEFGRPTVTVNSPRRRFDLSTDPTTLKVSPVEVFSEGTANIVKQPVPLKKELMPQVDPPASATPAPVAAPAPALQAKPLSKLEKLILDGKVGRELEAGNTPNRKLMELQLKARSKPDPAAVEPTGILHLLKKLLVQ